MNCTNFHQWGHPVGQLGTKCWFTFCPSKSAWPIVPLELAQLPLRVLLVIVRVPTQLKVPPPAFTTDPAAVGASHKHTDQRDEFWPKVNVTDEHSRKLEMRPRSNAAPPRKLPETAQRAIPPVEDSSSRLNPDSG